MLDSYTTVKFCTLTTDMRLTIVRKSFPSYAIPQRKGSAGPCPDGSLKDGIQVDDQGSVVLRRHSLTEVPSTTPSRSATILRLERMDIEKGLCTCSWFLVEDMIGYKAVEVVSGRRRRQQPE
jgi:hypothetical protein